MLEKKKYASLLEFDENKCLFSISFRRKTAINKTYISILTFSSISWEIVHVKIEVVRLLLHEMVDIPNS